MRPLVYPTLLADGVQEIKGVVKVGDLNHQSPAYTHNYIKVTL